MTRKVYYAPAVAVRYVGADGKDFAASLARPRPNLNNGDIVITDKRTAFNLVNKGFNHFESVESIEIPDMDELLSEIDRLKGELETSKQGGQPEVTRLNEEIDRLKGELETSKQESQSEITRLNGEIDRLNSELANALEFLNDDETVTTDETPAAGETVNPDETPAAGETVNPDETPVAGETVNPDETPAAGETVTTDETPAAGEAKQPKRIRGNKNTSNTLS